MAFAVPVPYQARREHSGRLRLKVKDPNDNLELVCSKCLKNGLIFEAFGFCRTCLDFLCSKCVQQHKKTLSTIHHGVVTGNDMMSRYRNAMAKARKTAESSSRLDMVSNDKAEFYYNNDGKKVATKEHRPEKYAEYLHKSKVRISNDDTKCFVCCCIILSSDRILVADANNNKIKLFNKLFNCMSVFNMRREPWDMCTSMIHSKTDFFVTESQVKGIHHFRADTSVEYIYTIKIDGECFGISNWSSGIAVTVKTKKKYEIRFLDHFGNVISRFSDGSPHKLRLVTPWYLTSNHKGQQVIISDAEAGTVTSVDVNGKIAFIHRKNDLDPRNVAVDADDNIYIIDYETDSVLQLSPSGRDLGTVLSLRDGLDQPSGLASYNGLLFLQNKMDSNWMHVYDLV